jgi:hypothetical protein
MPGTSIPTSQCRLRSSPRITPFFSDAASTVVPSPAEITIWPVLEVGRRRIKAPTVAAASSTGIVTFWFTASSIQWSVHALTLSGCPSRGRQPKSVFVSWYTHQDVSSAQSQGPFQLGLDLGTQAPNSYLSPTRFEASLTKSCHVGIQPPVIHFTGAARITENYNNRLK